LLTEAFNATSSIVAAEYPFDPKTEDAAYDNSARRDFFRLSFARSICVSYKND